MFDSLFYPRKCKTLIAQEILMRSIITLSLSPKNALFFIDWEEAFN